MQQPLNAGRQYITPDPNKTQTFYSSGINWVWYLTIEFIGKSRCRIIRHWNIHQCATDHPKADFTFRMIEDSKPIPGGWTTRNAVAVRLWRKSDGEAGKRLRVVNPGYVFGYDGKTEQPGKHPNYV